MLYNKDWEIKIETNPTAKVLRDAADLIERFGHTKHTLEERDGRMCFMGALYKASGWWQSTIHNAAVCAVARYLGLSLPRIDCEYDVVAKYYVVDWNNDSTRTAQEVIDAMRGAADMLER